MLNKEFIALAIISVLAIAGCIGQTEISKSEGALREEAALESVQKIVYFAYPNWFEITPYSSKTLKTDGTIRVELPLTQEDFRKLQTLILSEDFKNLEDIYKVKLPEGASCTQSGLQLNVTYKIGEIKNIKVDGCATSPKILQDVENLIGTLSTR